MPVLETSELGEEGFESPAGILDTIEWKFASFKFCGEPYIRNVIERLDSGRINPKMLVWTAPEAAGIRKGSLDLPSEKVLFL